MLVEIIRCETVYLAVRKRILCVGFQPFDRHLPPAVGDDHGAACPTFVAGIVFRDADRQVPPPVAPAAPL